MKNIIRDRGHEASLRLIEEFYHEGHRKMEEKNYVGAALHFRAVSIVYETADCSFPLSEDTKVKIDNAVQNIIECQKKIEGGIDFTLSKTSFTYAMQCSKRLFLYVNHPKEKTPPDEKTIELFKLGRTYEKLFKDQFENAIDVSKHCGNNFKQYPTFTFESLNEPIDTYPYIAKNQVFFEAGFCYNDVLVMVDVLQRDSDENYEVFEVKLYPEIKEVTWWDLTVQYYVLSNILPHIEAFNVVLLGENQSFNIVNVLDEVKRRLPLIEEKISEFKKMLSASEMPAIPMGEHCYSPYKCDFVEYCKKTI